MPIYVLELPGLEFTGFKGGVDFVRGRGSTSSRDDALRLVAKLGCRIVEPESEIIEAGAGQPAPVVSPDKPAEAPVYANKADRQHQDKVNQIFGAKKKKGA